MWTEEKIKEICVEAASQFDLEFNIPIVLNSRLRSSLGRFVSLEDKPVRLEMSTKFLDEAEDQSIINVILHETAHYIALMIYGESCGHDKNFKDICSILGCNGETKYNPQYKIEPVKAASRKYELFCPECGRIKGYDRMGKVLKNIERYMCPHCSNKELYYTQNW